MTPDQAPVSMAQPGSASPSGTWPFERRHDFGVIVLVGTLTLLFFWPYLTPISEDRIYFPDGDFTRQFYAYRVLAYRSFAQGDVPLWSTCLFSGYPFQADPQSALFYPPSLLIHGALLATGAQDYPLSALVFEVVLHIFLAATFTYLFLRNQVRRQAAALLGALVFGFGGFLTGYPLLQVAILEGVVWLPLALWAVDRFYRSGSLMVLALAAASIGLSVLAGHPQTSSFVVLVVMAYSLFFGRREKGSIRRIVVATASLFLAAAALSAVQWLPSWELLQHSSRAGGPLEAGGGFPFGDVIQFVVAGVVSLWHPLYVGILPLILVVFAWLAYRRWDPNIVFWTVLAFFALLMSFGDRLFLYDLARRFVPGYSLFRGPERHALLVAFSLSVLAAYGADALAAPLARRERRLLQMLFGFIVVVAGAPVLWLAAAISSSAGGSLPENMADTAQSVTVFLVLLLLAAGVLALRIWLRSGRVWVASLIVAVAIFDLFTQNRAVNASAPYELYPVTPVVQPMVEDPGLFRIQDDFRLPGHTSCVLGLKETWGMSPLHLARYEAFHDRVPERVRLDLLAVRYVVSWRGQLVTREGDLVEAEILYDDGEGTALHRILGSQPWAFVPRQVEVVADEEEVLARLSRPGFDPGEIAVVERSPLQPAPGSRGTSEVISYRAHEVVLRTEMDEPGLLVVKDIFYPGWMGRVDGQPVPMYRADSIFRAMVLDEGVHEVKMTYEPQTFRVGAAASAASWGLLLVVAGWRVGRLLRSRVID